ncbi:MAG: cadmium-translocating P-type ATPase [Oscillospiraceae bacterium]|nr:cadmium-translocating P-type ATPase [Candidatus Equicaccousia limihippi]
MNISSKQKNIIRLIIGALSLAALVMFEIFGIKNTAAVFIAFAVGFIAVGFEVLKEGADQIVKREFTDEHLLMSIAVLCAAILGEYTECIAVLVFYLVGEMLEDAAKGHSERSIASLMDLKPETATVLRDGEILTVEPSAVAVGETVVIDPFCKIPLDCTVIDGQSEIDLSMLTGESMPKEVSAGDKLLSGSVNGGGRLTATVTSDYQNSTAAVILDLIENAAERKSSRERFIAKFARIYTPIVVIAAVLLAVVPALFGLGFTTYLKRALVFLVASCPCALVISIPLAYFCAVGAASKKGILIKGTGHIETLAAVDTLFVDKTGTLTQGRFSVSASEPSGITKEELLEIRAVCESGSSHPIAQAFKGYLPKDLKPVSITEKAGGGVTARYNNKKITVGSKRFLEKNRVKIPEIKADATTVYAAVDGKYAGYVELSDSIKPDSKNAVEELIRRHIKVVMLTGDSGSAAQKVAESLGIKEYESELLPADKLKKAQSEKESGKTVAFAGDGINDAPVLKLCDVGIAMGKGSDAAIEAADAVSMNNRLSDIVTAVDIAKKTARISLFNLIVTLIVKAAVLVLGALGMANMWTAVAADVGVLIIAALNALRCLKIK